MVTCALEQGCRNPHELVEEAKCHDCRRVVHIPCFKSHNACSGEPERLFCGVSGVCCVKYCSPHVAKGFGAPSEERGKGEDTEDTTCAAGPSCVGEGNRFSHEMPCCGALCHLSCVSIECHCCDQDGRTDVSHKKRESIFEIKTHTRYLFVPY